MTQRIDGDQPADLAQRQHAPPLVQPDPAAPARQRRSTLLRHSASTALAQHGDGVATWSARAALGGLVVLIAVIRPGLWLALQALLLTVGLAVVAGWRGRQLRLVVLGISVFVAAVDYLSWRATVLSWTGWWIGIPLFVAELHAALHTLGFHATLWPRKSMPLHPRLNQRELPILVMVPTVDEGPGIVGDTLIGILAARDRYYRDYPGARITVAVCNDGDVAGAACSQDIIALAADLGVECVTRTQGGGAKAGNIENARQLLGGTGHALLVIFDADQIPHEDFFLRTVEPFSDPDVGWVQTGQYYRNLDNPVARWADEQQSLFYGLLCAGKAEHDAAFICGTNVVIRAAALDEIGGLPTDSVTEDFAASIMLAPRWRSVYLSGVLATGLGPVDVASYLKQQERWARGTLSVLRRHWRDLLLPRRNGMRANQRLQYGLAATHYLCGLRDLIFVIAPVLFLLTGASGVRGATLTAFLEHFVPYYALALVAFCHAAWGIGGWRPIVLGFASFPALLRAAWMTLAGQRGGFTVTPKRRVSGGVARVALPYGVSLGFCGAALGVALSVSRSPAHWLAAFWLAYLSVMLLLALSLVRQDHRLANADAAGAANSPDGDWLQRVRVLLAPRPKCAHGDRPSHARRGRPKRWAGVAAGVAAVIVMSALAEAHATSRRPQPAPIGLPARPLVGVNATTSEDVAVLRTSLGIQTTINGRTFEPS